MSTLLNTIRARLAGDSLRGLVGAPAAEKVRALTTERLLELRAAERERCAEITAAIEDARGQDLAAFGRACDKMVDAGRSDGVFQGTESMQRTCRAIVSAHADEFGLRDLRDADVSAGNIIEASRLRVSLIEQELRQRYRRDGLPKAAEDLKVRHSKAKADVWPLRQRLVDARKAYNALRGEHAERAVMDAHAAVEAAEAAAAAIVRELADRFAVYLHC